MQYVAIAAVLMMATLTGCEAINPLSPKTTHTMEEVVKDVSQLRRSYDKQTITIKATVNEVRPLTANEDEVKLVTNHPLVDFTIVASRGYKVGRSYVFTIYIDSVYHSLEYKDCYDGHGNRRTCPTSVLSSFKFRV